MKRLLTFVLLLAVSFQLSAFLSGCAEIKPPTPAEIIRQPLGGSPLRIGMTKAQVDSIWGEPDLIRPLESASRQTLKEEWIYRGRYPNLPINVDYLSETQHLIFDGNNLVQLYHQK